MKEMEKFKLPELEKLDNLNNEDTKQKYSEAVDYEVKKEFISLNTEDELRKSNEEDKNRNVQETENITLEDREKIEKSIKNIENSNTEIIKIQTDILNSIKNNDIKEEINAQVKPLENIIENQKTIIENQVLLTNEISFNQDLKDSITSLINYGKIMEDKIDKIEYNNNILIRKILEKILNKEISSESNIIILNSFKLIYEEIKSSQNIKLFLNPVNYNQIKDIIMELDTQKIIEILEDKNILLGNILILSDKGNFDNNLQNKLDLILKSIL
jgi:flagellar biosynthesis/type III secretory pathway protein FliH